MKHMPLALGSHRISLFPSRPPQRAVDPTVRAASRRAGTGATAPPPRLPGNQRAQPSLKGKDKQRSAFPLTLRDRQSILAPRASPPLWRALVPGRGPVVGTHNETVLRGVPVSCQALVESSGCW